mmetsp:Transcript_29167/g.88265  ORF Transcript_29167/g.88265 Transcript_29167/m.88265 type:complete len:228 (-) Transcript_29167:486-1169(-)
MEKRLAGPTVELGMRRHRLSQGAGVGVETNAAGAPAAVEFEAEWDASFVHGPQLALRRESEAGVRRGRQVLRELRESVVCGRRQEELSEPGRPGHLRDAEEVPPLPLQVEAGRLHERAVVHRFAAREAHGVHHAIAVEHVRRVLRRPLCCVRPDAHEGACDVARDLAGLDMQRHVARRRDGLEGPTQSGGPAQRALHVLQGVQPLEGGRQGALAKLLPFLASVHRHA